MKKKEIYNTDQFYFSQIEIMYGIGIGTSIGGLLINSNT